MKLKNIIKRNVGYAIGFSSAIVISGTLLFFGVYFPIKIAEWFFGELSIAWSNLSGFDYDMDF